MKINKLTLIMLACVSVPSWSDTIPTIIDKDNPTKIARAVKRTDAAPSLESDKQQQQQNANTNNLTLNSVVDFKALQFAGGSKYSKETLAQPFRQLIGKQVTLGALVQATQEITNLYHQDGYPLSFAYLPSNNFQHGVVTVILVEGYLSDVKIESDNENISTRLKRLTQPLLTEKPLSSKTFERASQLMARTPDATVVASADLPKNNAGATPLTIKANHPHYWNIGSAIDSRKGSSSAFINATFSGFTSFAEQLGIATLIPLDNKDNKKYLGLSYQQFLTDDGLQMQLKGSYYQQKPKRYTYLLTVPNTNVDLEAKKAQTQYNGGVQLSYPLMLTAREQWMVTGGVDYTDKKYEYQFQLKQNNLTFPVTIDNTDQRIKYSAGEIGLSGQHIYDMAYWTLRLNLRQGLGGKITNNQLDNEVTFTRWRAGTDAAYYLSPTWRISTGLDGFWSDNNLPESEQVSYGGLRFGRGYADGEISGDYGYGGQVELRYLHGLDYKWLKTVQPYVVVDTARTYSNADLFKSRKIASYALGATFSDNKHYNISLEGARPIASIPNDSTKRDYRFNVTFSYNFNSF